MLLSWYLLKMDQHLPILKLYSQISSNKKFVSEVYVKPKNISYSNIDFKERTLNDDVPAELLDDINNAAKLANVNISVDWVKTGHNKFAKSGKVSRHFLNNAVDISTINGKAISYSNKNLVDKFVDILVGMGYVKNQESGNDKSVLTFGFPNHDNHIHVSNQSGKSSEVPDQYQKSEPTDDSIDDYVKKIKTSGKEQIDKITNNELKLSDIDSIFQGKDLKKAFAASTFGMFKEELKQIKRLLK